MTLSQVNALLEPDRPRGYADPRFPGKRVYQTRSREEFEQLQREIRSRL